MPIFDAFRWALLSAGELYEECVFSTLIKISGFPIFGAGWSTITPFMYVKWFAILDLFWSRFGIAHWHWACNLWFLQFGSSFREFCDGVCPILPYRLLPIFCQFTGSQVPSHFGILAVHGWDLFWNYAHFTKETLSNFSYFFTAISSCCGWVFTPTLMHLQVHLALYLWLTLRDTCKSTVIVHENQSSRSMRSLRYWHCSHTRHIQPQRFCLKAA